MNVIRLSFKHSPFWLLIVSLAMLVQVVAQSPPVLRKTGDALMKEIVKWQEPEFPPIARHTSAGGAVLVELEIDELGDVVSARVVFGHPLLQAAMLKAARAWKFRPAKVNGVPVRLAGRIAYNFPITEPLLKEKTIDELEKQAREKPASAETRYELAMAYFRATRYGEAVLQLSAAIRLKPGYTDAYLKLGHSYSRLSAHEKALEAFTEAGRLDPNSSEAFHALGLANIALERYEEAVTALKRSLEVEGPITTSYFLLGKCYLRLDRPKQAVASYKEGLAKYPDSDMGHYGLGETYLDLEQYADAISEFKLALKLSDGPGKAETHYQLGLAYLRAGDKESALEEYTILKPVRADLAEMLLREIETSNRTKLVGRNELSPSWQRGASNSYDHKYVQV
jgi:TonB family protein